MDKSREMLPLHPVIQPAAVLLVGNPQIIVEDHPVDKRIFLDNRRFEVIEGAGF
ncbi:hypothetical protein D3C81_1815100 [compost metagenome]